MLFRSGGGIKTQKTPPHTETNTSPSHTNPDHIEIIDVVEIRNVEGDSKCNNITEKKDCENSQGEGAKKDSKVLENNSNPEKPAPPEPQKNIQVEADIHMDQLNRYLNKQTSYLDNVTELEKATYKHLYSGYLPGKSDPDPPGAAPGTPGSAGGKKIGRAHV